MSSIAHHDRDATLGPSTVGEALRLLRHRARQNRDQLASAVGVSAGAISNYENDVSTPPAPTLRRITITLAAMLGMEAWDLWEQFGKIMDAGAGQADGSAATG